MKVNLWLILRQISIAIFNPQTMPKLFVYKIILIKKIIEIKLKYEYK